MGCRRSTVDNSVNLLQSTVHTTAHLIEPLTYFSLVSGEKANSQNILNLFYKWTR